MKFSRLPKFRFLVILWLCSPPANAQNSFDLFAGYAFTSKLESDVSLDIALTPAGFQYQRFLKSWNTSLGLTSVFSSASYQTADTQKSGVFYSVGLTVSNNFFEGKHLKAGWSLAYYPYTVLAVASQTKVSVNDQTIVHSSVTSFSGNQGFGAKIGAFYPGKKSAKYRIGSELEYTQHKFNRRSIKVVSSNPDLSPGRDTVEEANETLGIGSILFLVGLTI
ncbi:MAG: hypothetical protein AB7T49_08025 [Oligoflexales bacterium]